MKTFYKIFVAVAFAFASFACTTDATNDLGIDVTSITLSLEESRTHLGERAGDLYPLYWSEGDQISVNGVASSALSTDAAGAATATFTVAGTLEKPYCIAYPAAPAGQVLFAEKQTHTSNTTFGSGVSTMYAYSEDGAGAQLNHLTGVLKIGVVGSAKLVLAQVSTADRKPIAGAFDFNFEKGEASATATSKELIERANLSPHRSSCRRVRRGLCNPLRRGWWRDVCNRQGRFSEAFGSRQDTRVCEQHQLRP